MIEELSGELLEDVVDLNHDIFVSMYPWPPYNLQQYKAKLPEHFFMVGAYANGELAGDAICFERDQACYLWILGVSPHYQGQGLGRELLEYCIDHAKKEGFHSLTTKVYEVSKAMIGLIKSYKFQPVDVVSFQGVGGSTYVLQLDED